MAGGGKKENRRVSRLIPLSAALLLFSGCQTLNDSLVRQWLGDAGLSRRVHDQIREGMQRREKAPVPYLPARPAPAFLDEG